MNKLFLTAVLGVVCVSAFGQGTLNFANAAPGLQAQVTDTDGVTGLSGSAWSADLYWAPGTVSDSTILVALNQPTTFSMVNAGYFFGQTRTVPLVPLGFGVITAQVRVWDTASGNSWAQAAATQGARVGESILFQVVLANPNLGGGPGTPTTMTGLNGHPWSVSVVSIPEPCTVTLVGLGLVGILVLHRSRFCRSLRVHSPAPYLAKAPQGQNPV